MVNLYDDSFLTDEIVDAAQQAAYEYAIGPDAPLNNRDKGITRQMYRVALAAALEAGLLDKIRETYKCVDCS